MSEGYPSSPRSPILIVAHDVVAGRGMERCLIELIERLCRDRPVHLVAVTVDDALKDSVVWHRVRIPRRPLLLKFIVFWIVGGWVTYRARRGCLVQTTGAIVPNAVDVGVVHLCHAGARAKRGTRPAADRITLRAIHRRMFEWLAIAAEAWVYRPARTRVLIAVSTGLAREVESFYPGTRVEVIANGVAPSREQRVHEYADCKLLFVGGNWEHKGLPLVVQALALLPEAWSLTVVGQGDAASLRRLCRRHGVEHRVQLLGPLEEVQDVYTSSDVLVLPSEYESFSLVAHEAALCGLPIVATRVHGVQDLVGANQGGCLVNRTPESIAEGCLALADPAERQRRAAHARKIASGRTWSDNFAAYAKLYAELDSDGN